MQNIKWQDKISDETLYKNTKQEPIVQTIQRRQLRFIGHCLRRDKKEFKNSPINMPSIHHSLDMESANKVGQN